jgi:sigma-B regulation protein RsbU (phosphoserine phosphatase)
MSIRYKLLILILTITALSLASFLGLAVYLFKRDKIAYIYDASAANSRGLANQIRTELKMHSSILDLFVSGYDFNQRVFDKNSLAIFNKNENLLEVSIHKWDGQSFASLASIKKPDFEKMDQNLFATVVEQVERQAYQDTISFQVFSPDVNYLIFAQKLIVDGESAPFFVISINREESISRLLKKSPNFENFLVRADGQILLQSKKDTSLKNLSEWDYFKKITAENLPDNTAQATNLAGQISLNSFTKVGVANLVAISSIEKKLALSAIDELVLQAGVYFILLICLAIPIAMYASSQVTRRLMILDSATTELAGGNFEVNLDINSNDEVGSLSKNFNAMVAKVSVLMKDNVDKARMEKELETAKVVQDTLFPERHSQIDQVQISGYYEPASECGGDWWYYFKSGPRVFVCIGDATGHGASAALITSAARSAVSLIETSPSITPASFLQMLNRAIYVSSKGHIQMTFFVACIDPDKNKMTYANASHNAPYMIKKSAEPIKKKDLIPLLSEDQGFRLGQEISSRYGEVVIDFEPGDRLFLYTDGLTDIENPDGKLWEERGLIKSLTSAATKNDNIQTAMVSIVTEANEFRSGAPLKDDVTFFGVHFIEKLEEKLGG